MEGCSWLLEAAWVTEAMGAAVDRSGCRGETEDGLGLRKMCFFFQVVGMIGLG